MSLVFLFVILFIVCIYGEFFIETFHQEESAGPSNLFDKENAEEENHLLFDSAKERYGE